MERASAVTPPVIPAEVGGGIRVITRRALVFGLPDNRWSEVAAGATAVWDEVPFGGELGRSDSGHRVYGRPERESQHRVQECCIPEAGSALCRGRPSLRRRAAEVYHATRVIDLVISSPAATVFRFRRPLQLLDLTGEWTLASAHHM